MLNGHPTFPTCKRFRPGGAQAGARLPCVSTASIVLFSSNGPPPDSLRIHPMTFTPRLAAQHVKRTLASRCSSDRTRMPARLVHDRPSTSIWIARPRLLDPNRPARQVDPDLYVLCNSWDQSDCVPYSDGSPSGKRGLHFSLTSCPAFIFQTLGAGTMSPCPPSIPTQTTNPNSSVLTHTLQTVLTSV